MSSELQEWDYRENPMPTKAALRWLAIAMIIQAGFGLLQIALVSVDFLRLLSEESDKQSVGLIIFNMYALQISFVIVGILLSSISTVVYLEVVYRINLNAKVIEAERISLTPKWAVISYFIPVGNLFLPYVNLQQVWKVGRQSGENAEGQSASNLIRLFWIVLLVENCALILSCPSLFVSIINRASGLELLGRSLMVLNCFLAWAVLYRCEQRLRARLVIDESYGG